MNRNEFLECLGNKTQTPPVKVMEFLNKVDLGTIPKPDWLFEFKERSKFVAQGKEFYVFPEVPYPEYEFSGADAVVSVPVALPYTVWIDQHRKTGYTQLVYKNECVFTISSGPAVDGYRSLEAEFNLANDLASQRQNMHIFCQYREGKIKLYYSSQSLITDSLKTFFLAEAEYSPKIACNWKLRAEEYDREDSKSANAYFGFLTNRATFRLLYLATKELNLEIGPACEILPVPADVTGARYGFSLCKEMLDPNAVVNKVLPYLQGKGDQQVSSALLEDIGICPDDIPEWIAETPEPVQNETYTEDGNTLPVRCSKCNHFLVRVPSITIVGSRVPGICPRCWNEQSVDITPEIKNAFAKYFVT